MIFVRNELEFQNWFKENYKNFDFEKIVKSTNAFPDFIMYKNGKNVSVELETHSSNFLLHKHDPKKVDEVICIIEDISLEVPTRVAKEVRLTKDKTNSSYSMLDLIKKLLKENTDGLTAAEISKKLKISRNTVAVALAELKGAQMIRVREIGMAKLNYLNNKK